MARSKAKPDPDRAGSIYRTLRHAIIEQALEPGAKLPEDTIGERFGASRTIVRSALGQLAAEGLVELRRNRGAAVAPPAWEEARDTFDVRLGIEHLVMSRLAGRLSKEQIKTLERMWTRKNTRGATMSRCRYASRWNFISARANDRKPGSGALCQ